MKEKIVKKMTIDLNQVLWTSKEIAFLEIKYDENKSFTIHIERLHKFLENNNLLINKEDVI